MTDFIVTIINIVEHLIMMFIPEVTLAPEILSNLSSVFDTIFDLFNQVNFLIPLTDAFLILTLDIAFRVLLSVVFVGNWVLRRVFDVIP